MRLTNYMTPDVEGTLVKSQEWLKENTKRFAFKKLEREIIATEVCVECGTCTSNCPVDAITGEMVESKYIPTLTGKCISCGICYAMCPRTKILPEQLLGEYKTIWLAKRTMDGGKRQDGGVATALMTGGIRKKLLDAAVVAVHDEDKWKPKSLITTSEDEVMNSGGTIYTHAPIVAGMMEAFREGYSKVGVVGTSCNLDAVDRLQTHMAGFLAMDKDADATKIGLFCMESFDYSRLKSYLKENGIDIQNVKRMAIAGGKFSISVNGEEHEWPVSDLDVAAAKSCSYCHDLTAKHADISCGNIGSDEGYTTVIVRTEKGEKLFLQCIKEGLIEAEPLDEKSIQSIHNVARSKATRYYKMESLH